MLFGTKSTIGDLAFLRAQGWATTSSRMRGPAGASSACAAGSRLLGRRVHDPDGADGPAGSVDGLGSSTSRRRCTPRRPYARRAGAAP